MGYCWIYAWHLCIKGMQSVQAATYWHSNVHVEICLYNPLQRHIRCWYNAECFQWRSSIERNWYDRALVIDCVHLYRSIFPRIRHKCHGTKGSANIRTYVIFWKDLRLTLPTLLQTANPKKVTFVTIFEGAKFWRKWHHNRLITGRLCGTFLRRRG